MKKNKMLLFIMILIFITVFFSLNFFADKLWTGLGKGEKNEDFLSEDDNYKKGGYVELEKIPELEKILELVKIPELDVAKDITATISVTGDIMFHMPQIRSGYNSESDSYDFTSVFEEIEPYISPSDIAIANLETVVAGNEYSFSGFPRFNSPEEILKAIGETGFDVLSTANNHSIDRGKTGIINTIDFIKKYNMTNVGTYKEPTQRVLIKEVNGIKLGLISYTYGCNGLESLLTDEELNYMVNIIDEEKIKEDIQLAETMGVDMTLVLIHWGNEYQLEPSEEQKTLGRKMLEWGADIILGSHPHVIQKSEIVQHNGEKKFIIYSMGNFISNQRRETISNSRAKYTEDGIIITLELIKHGLTGRTTIKDVDFIPTWVYRYKEDGKLTYKIVPTVDYVDVSSTNNDELSQTVLSKIKESYEQTMKKMDK